MADIIGNSKAIKQLVVSAFYENSLLSSSYQDVFKAYVLFLTLPVTTATAGRSFSELKLIKNIMPQEQKRKHLIKHLVSFLNKDRCSIFGPCIKQVLLLYKNHQTYVGHFVPVTPNIDPRSCCTAQK